MIILCILIFPFAVLAELMKVNNRGGCRRWEDLYIGFEENGESRRSVADSAAWFVRIMKSVAEITKRKEKKAKIIQNIYAKD